MVCGSMFRSTRSSSGFKASQMTGQRLNVTADRLGEAGSRLFEVEIICMNESTCLWVDVIYLLTYLVVYGTCL